MSWKFRTKTKLDFHKNFDIFNIHKGEIRPILALSGNKNPKQIRNSQNLLFNSHSHLLLILKGGSYDGAEFTYRQTTGQSKVYH